MMSSLRRRSMRCGVDPSMTFSLLRKTEAMRIYGMGSGERLPSLNTEGREAPVMLLGPDWCESDDERVSTG